MTSIRFYLLAFEKLYRLITDDKGVNVARSCNCVLRENSGWINDGKNDVPQRATTQQLFGLVNLEETILMETHNIYISILDKTHLTTELLKVAKN